MKLHPSLLAALVFTMSGVAAAQEPRNLADLSIEDLLEIEVTSVSRREQTVAQTAAAVHVITQDDIRRSGATNLPDVLRMVPGLQVGQLSASTWSVASRGLTGTYSNRVLVLIDGRSVYSPLYGGVHWEMLLIPLDIIKQIEVIRGPGGALWGANAVNGVINVITSAAGELQGGQATTTVSRYEPGTIDVRFGGSFGVNGRHVTSARYFQRSSPIDNQIDGGDSFYARTRMDWESRSGDRFSFTGDVMRGEQLGLGRMSTLTPPYTTTVRTDTGFHGGNAQLSWTRTHSATARSSVQAYYSGASRNSPLFGERLHIVDVDARRQQTFGRHTIVAGAQFRFWSGTVPPTPVVTTSPEHSYETLSTGFVQDEMSLPGGVRVTPGIKVERNTYTGLELQPSARVLWNPAGRQSVWGAVSRAVRTPTRLDQGLRLIYAVVPSEGPLPVAVTQYGSADVTAETTNSVEGGYRITRGRLVLDATAFHAAYGDLVSVPTTPVPRMGSVFGVPAVEMALTLRNEGEGTIRGVETSLTWELSKRWRATGSYAFLDVELRASPGTSDNVVDMAANGPAPRHQFHARTFVDLPKNTDAGVLFYRVSSIPNGVEAYNKLDVRFGWKVNGRFDFAAGGQNLLPRDEIEYLDPSGVRSLGIRRNVYGQLTARF